jgi:prepilin-type N-terminal cleavage/methylation domain-containing protein
MRPAHNHAGFTLVEMLFVIVVVLVAALQLPRVQEALDSGAIPAAMKSKGRGIWVAITSANMEREIAKLGPLWPHELRLPVDQGGGGQVFTTATEYFKILMTNDRPGHQLVPDLEPNMLATYRYPSTANTKTLTPQNIGWHVTEVSATFSSSDAFLIGKDVNLIARSGPSNELVSFSRAGTFRGRRLIWVTKGGGILDMKRVYRPTWGHLLPSTNNVPFLPD